jgi:hypothetical protein
LGLLHKVTQLQTRALPRARRRLPSAKSFPEWSLRCDPRQQQMRRHQHLGLPMIDPILELPLMLLVVSGFSNIDVAGIARAVHAVLALMTSRFACHDWRHWLAGTSRLLIGMHIRTIRTAPA